MQCFILHGNGFSLAIELWTKYSEYNLQERNNPFMFLFCLNRVQLINISFSNHRWTRDWWMLFMNICVHIFQINFDKWEWFAWQPVQVAIVSIFFNFTRYLHRNELTSVKVVFFSLPTSCIETFESPSTKEYIFNLLYVYVLCTLCKPAIQPSC